MFAAGMGYALGMMQNQSRSYGANSYGANNSNNNFGASYHKFGDKNDLYGPQNMFTKKSYGSTNPVSGAYVGAIPQESLSPYGANAGKSYKIKMPANDKYRQAA